MKNELKIENLTHKMSIIDEEGNQGIVVNCEDAHNVAVSLKNGGFSLYCMIENCDLDKKIKLYKISDEVVKKIN